MKKIIFVGGVALLLVVLGIIGFGMGTWSVSRVYAQVQAESDQPATHGYGMRGGAGSHGRMGRGSGMMGLVDQDSQGLLHDTMIAALATGLEMTPEALEQSLANGESLYSIAQAQGLTVEQVQALWSSAHSQALEQATAAGVITQEQADWMLQRHTQMQPNHGTGVEGCPMTDGTWNGPGWHKNQTDPQP